jgi:8-oxo-dGTP pyrophosphatase MutT (NUDIX family)
MNPRTDFAGPKTTAQRELFEEGGFKLESGPQSLEAITILDAPTTGHIEFDGGIVRLTNGDKPAYKHPHSLRLFATSASFQQVGEPDGEVTDIRWQTLRDLIAEHGSDSAFCYPAVVLALLYWLKSGHAFEYDNEPGRVVEINL